MPVLDHPGIRRALAQAWVDSCPNTPHAHEEGGFIVRQPDGSLQVLMWPRGTSVTIPVPAHPGGCVEGRLIAASFHTHPHQGAEYRPGPSLMDVLTVATDNDLRHPEFEGEYVIGSEQVWRIRANGFIDEMGLRKDLI
jgi:hypothetical protein